MESHNIAVATIAAQVHQFSKSKLPFRIHHGSTNSTRQSQQHSANTVSTASLTNVLHVDSAAQTAVVEPNVPMDQLVRASMAHGLVPLVVMEFPGITVGGGFSGTSGESSSFRRGFFHETVNWIEIVAATGEVITASDEEFPDLFHGAAEGFGTLGVVTLLEVQLKEASPFVHLEYFHAGSMDEAMRVFRDVANDEEVEYLDGVVYARDQIVVCAGRSVGSLPANTTKPTRFTRAQDPWFYLHAQRRGGHNSSATTPTVDYIPLEDYLFRYDRGGFWVGRYAYSYFITPFNRITRFLLDSFMRTRVMYHALHASGFANKYIIQDVAVPYSKTTEFLDWLDQPENFGNYPLWLCPLRQSSGLMTSGDFKEKTDHNDPLMNFGIWGPPCTGNRTEFIAQNRRLESKVLELQGRKWLYAHTYYTEDEFWSMYDKSGYDALREKYLATYLPDLYAKVRVDLRPDGDHTREPGLVGWVKGRLWEVWPVSGLYGVYKAWRGGEYLIKK